MLSVHLALAALRKAALEVACVPGYAFFSSRLVMAVTWSLTAASGSSVRTVLIDGRLVLDDGRLTTLDERALYAREERLSREHVRLAGVPIDTKWPVIP